MRVISSIDAWYPLFSLGCEPAAVKCTLSIVEANGRRHLRTPFAFLDAHADDDHKRQLGRGYYATGAECLAYLEYQYPWWRLARPLMERLFELRRVHGEVVGTGRFCDLVGLPPAGTEWPQLARGHKRIGLKRIKEALRSLETASAGR